MLHDWKIWTCMKREEANLLMVSVRYAPDIIEVDPHIGVVGLLPSCSQHLDTAERSKTPQLKGTACVSTS